MKRSALFMLLLLLSPAAAWANDCDNAADQATMTSCAVYAFKQDDAELNSAYSELKGRYAEIADAKAVLVKAQRAWVAFRDAECNLEAFGESGGSAQPMIFNQCLSRLTQARISDIRARLNCQEGDMTCISDTDAAN